MPENEVVEEVLDTAGEESLQEEGTQDEGQVQEGLCEQSIEVLPDGEESDKRIVLEGLMPENVTAEAVDVTEERDSNVIAAYDITLSDGEEEFQPDEANPINVEITDDRISGENTNLELWHVLDDGTREQITGFTIENGKICFAASGFSVYEIVDVPSVDRSITTWDAFMDVCADGIYLGHPNGYYYKNTLETKDNRTGIKKSAPSPTPTPDASLYYFVKVNNDNPEDHYFYIYCKDDNGNNLYARNEDNNSLLLVSDENQKTAFEVIRNDNGTFKIHNDNWYWNMQGGNGGTRFCSYNKANDDNNTLKLWKKLSEDHEPYGLQGVSYGLVNYIGQAYGHALKAGNPNYLDVNDLVVRTDGAGAQTVFVTTDEELYTWTFDWAESDEYYISGTKDGVTQSFIKVSGNSVTFVDDKTQASKVKVIIGTGTAEGKIKLSADGMTIQFVDGTGFIASSSSGTGEWLYFVEKSTLSSNDYVTYSAEKISVSDPVEACDGAQIIVYTRIWDNHDKRYRFYAIDHDGSLVECFERGDNIMWVGDQVNTLLWELTVYTDSSGNPNNYYEFRNVYSGKYLAPQIGEGQVLSNKTIGVNLPERVSGEYYSTIIAWDDPYYAYAGLATDVSGDTIVSCPFSKAETFYFAKIQPASDTLTEVKTVDSKAMGVTMKMVDFSTDTVLDNALGGADVSDKNKLIQGLLTSYLVDDDKYPRTNTGFSFKEWFMGAAAKEVNHLFLESIYHASGYYEFDSCQDFATLIQPDGSVGTNFTVYKELGTTDSVTRSTVKHGQFLPYNTIRPGVFSTNNPLNLYSALANFQDASVGILPENDPRKYEKLYSIGKNPNYYNGMEIEAGFSKTPNGQDAWGHDMIFEFTGDDDFWLYVDGELIIDLGGTHSALEGKVNFATGDVIVNGVATKLDEIFAKNFRARYEAENPGATDTEEKVSEYLDRYFDKVNGVYQHVFKDYSQHTMKIFYFERGGGASNLHMRFNLSSVKPGNVLLEKKVSGSDDVDFNLVEYPFQIYYKDPKTGAETLLTDDPANNIGVKYRNSTQSVKYASSYRDRNGNVYNNVFFLTPDKSAEISFPDNTIDYRIVECSMSYEVYDAVYVNGVRMDTDGEGRRDIDTGWDKVEKRPSVTFDNHVDPQGLRTLSIKKVLKDENGNVIYRESDSTTFSYRLSLSNGSDNDLKPAYLSGYRVLDENGNYCKWVANGDDGYFESIGVNDISGFSNEQKENITFYTSPNGAISKIPAGYTVEVPNLLVDTLFKLEERDNEIPLGYKRVMYYRDGNSFIDIKDGDTHNSGRIRASQSPYMEVINQRGYELKANKIWADEKYMSSYDPIYTAVYRKDTVHNNETGEDTYTYTLIPGTIKRVSYPGKSVRVFMDSLDTGHTIDDYAIYEVELTNPSVDSDDVVQSYGEITRLASGDLTQVGATLTSGKTDSFGYEVGYSQGSAKSTVSGIANNIRTDNITNTRSGGVVITLYEMNTTNRLSGGKFTLKQGNTVIGTYTADENGRITILYDFLRDTDYTLVETESPTGYLGVPNPVVFSVSQDESTVAVSGNDEKWAKGKTRDTSADNLIAYIDVYNQPYTFSVYKCDKVTKLPLKDAHFALYYGINSLSGKVKDYYPIAGYEDLVSDKNGIIPKVNEKLPAGIYYLTETAAPGGYTAFDDDICFSIDTKGFVEVDQTYGNLLEETDLNEGKNYQYVISVPNEADGHVLTISKIVTGSLGNKDKDFTFTFHAEALPSNQGGNIDDTTEFVWMKNGETQTTKLSNDGNATFTMAHGDEVKIVIPGDVSVTITEANEDYKTTFRINGDIAEEVNTKTFDVTADTRLFVTNDKEAFIPTGVWMPLGGMITLAVILAAGGMYFTVNKRRYIKEL